MTISNKCLTTSVPGNNNKNRKFHDTKRRPNF